MCGLFITLVLLLQVLTPRGVQQLLDDSGAGFADDIADQTISGADAAGRSAGDAEPLPGENEDSEDDDDPGHAHPGLLQSSLPASCLIVCVSLSYLRHHAIAPTHVDSNGLQARGPPRA